MQLLQCCKSCPESSLELASNEMNVKNYLVSTSCECKIVDFGSVGPFQEGGGWGSNFRRWGRLKGRTVVSLLLPVDGDRGRHARLSLQEGVEFEAGGGFWPAANHSRDS